MQTQKKQRQKKASETNWRIVRLVIILHIIPIVAIAMVGNSSDLAASVDIRKPYSTKQFPTAIDSIELGQRQTDEKVPSLVRAILNHEDPFVYENFLYGIKPFQPKLRIPVFEIMLSKVAKAPTVSLASEKKRQSAQKPPQKKAVVLSAKKPPRKNPTKRA
jgi:hypothetical protein